MVYCLRVAQLLGLAGCVHGMIAWLTNALQLDRPKLIFYGAFLLLLICSTAVLPWLKWKYPQMAGEGIRSADKTWNTPIEEKRARIIRACFLVLAAAILFCALAIL